MEQFQQVLLWPNLHKWRHIRVPKRRVRLVAKPLEHGRINFVANKGLHDVSGLMGIVARCQRGYAWPRLGYIQTAIGCEAGQQRVTET